MTNATVSQRPRLRLPEEAGDIVVATPCGSDQRRGSCVRCPARIRPGLEETAHRLYVPHVGGDVQRGRSAGVRLVAVGSRLAQYPHDVGVAPARRDVQGRRPRLICTILVGAGITEQTHDVEVAPARSDVQGRGTCAVGLVLVATRVTEEPYHFKVPAATGHVQRRGKTGVLLMLLGHHGRRRRSRSGWWLRAKHLRLQLRAGAGGGTLAPASAGTTDGVRARRGLRTRLGQWLRRELADL